MVKLRGRYFKYKGKIAKEIIEDYNSGMLIKDIIEKYKISLGGLYGLLKREGIEEREEENGTKTNA